MSAEVGYWRCLEPDCGRVRVGYCLWCQQHIDAQRAAGERPFDVIVSSRLACVIEEASSPTTSPQARQAIVLAAVARGIGRIG